ncbi:type II toxin-antitoxin system VapC family toxin [Candidatus Marithrix sp. Canyon 246]|uniref:type II toxin-antitoxin system VapC family toxin n=1 Tax=Candidatus Marithrix sp. Canyon 246 TaxID=1827136 RepID=UPI000849FAD4|nr:PIN domain-containing protein [Candidatus Marithrix sp. Canyon 246]
MILVDTGPLVALFDPKDNQHQHCKTLLQTFNEPLISTTPVLTEAFHLLTPNSKGADALRNFIAKGGLNLWFLNKETMQTALQLMEIYHDRPMDLADASLVTAAQTLKISRIFTIDRNDFTIYRIRIGYQYKYFEVIS